MHGTIKKIPGLLTAGLLSAAVCTGCSSHTAVTIQADGSGEYEQTFTLSESLSDESLLSDETLLSEEIVLSYFQALYPQARITVSDKDEKGMASKTVHLAMDFKDMSEYQQIVSQSETLCSVTFLPNYFTKSRIYMPLEEESAALSGFSEELEQLLTSNAELAPLLQAELQNADMQLAITFPYSVTDTNGTIQKDHQTVVWKMKQMDESERLYALFRTSNSSAAPEYTGAADGKAYNTGVSLHITSENLLDRVKVNREVTQSDSLFLSEEGVYTITAADINGNRSRLSFRIDKTKPVISGVKHAKTYQSARTIRFSDPEGSGIQSALLNGSPIKTGKKVSQKGTYQLVVTDRAGNRKAITFKIR